MKAAYIEKTGPPDVIQWGELPTPEPRGSQVLVRVEAVAINPIDTYIRAGTAPMPLTMPYIPGCDLAGVVEQAGPEARRFKAGDRVWGSNQSFAGRQGTFAEFAAVEEQWLYPTPPGVESRSAAACALVGITGHLALLKHGGIKGGESVYISGGAGGLGSVALQMAKILNARVITAAGSPEKIELCRRFGADAVVNYKEAKLDDEVKRFAPGGLNLWLEAVRAPDFETIVPLMAKRARIVVMAGREAKPVFPVGAFYTRDLSLHGFAVFNATAEEQRICAMDIGRWLAAGELKPLIGRVMKLSEAAAAHRLQEENTIHGAGTLAGKIVLEP